MDAFEQYPGYLPRTYLPLLHRTLPLAVTLIYPLASWQSNPLADCHYRSNKVLYSL